MNKKSVETFEFTMKDTSGSYCWLLEGSTDLRDVEAMGVSEWVKATAIILIIGENYGDTSDEQVYQTWIDDTYESEQAVAFIQAKISNQINTELEDRNIKRVK
jgi:hypothetical protein